MSVLVGVGLLTAALVYRDAERASVSVPIVWALLALVTGGLGSLAYLTIGRKRTAPRVISMRERLPNVPSRTVEPEDAPAETEEAAPRRSRRLPAQALPPDPWGLEPDRSVAPLISKPRGWRRLAPDVRRQGGESQVSEGRS